MIKMATEKKDADEMYCHSCGEAIKKEAEICPKCGVRQKGSSSPPKGDKSKVAAGILAILLGGIGVHKFYLGYTGIGVLYLCFFWTGVPAILGIIEGIIYLTKTDDQFYDTYVKNQKKFF
jgi:TM2 domain-containing membrane protein YozV